SEPIEEPVEDEIDIVPTVVDEMVFEIEETAEEEDVMITLDADRLEAIRSAFKAADANKKASVREHLVNYKGNKLSDTMMSSDVDAIEEILGLNDEV
ncbi:MAG: hypothetical protein UHD64_10045, partial [Bacteroidales bacterium]|nr:hypothetical protein [Bacteroidales bacterium]